MQFAEVSIEDRSPRHVIELRYRGGTDVYDPAVAPEPGARSEGVRILRSRADARQLRLLLEGRNGRTYDLFLRTPRQAATVDGGALLREGGRDPMIRVRFEGPDRESSRREVIVALR